MSWTEIRKIWLDPEPAPSSTAERPLLRLRQASSDVHLESGYVPEPKWNSHDFTLKAQHFKITLKIWSFSILVSSWFKSLKPVDFSKGFNCSPADTC